MPISGISFPSMIYRFRVILDNHKNGVQPPNQNLTKNINSIDIDLKNKKLNISIRQDVLIDTWNEIISIMEPDFKLDIILEPSNGTSTQLSLVFNDCKIKNHNISYDYSAKDFAQHKLDIEFGFVRPIEPINWEKVGFSEEAISGGLTPEESVEKYKKEKPNE